MFKYICWSGALNNIPTVFQVSQNKTLKVTFNKNIGYHTETLYKDLKEIVIFLKKHNMINTIPHTVIKKLKKENTTVNLKIDNPTEIKIHIQANKITKSGKIIEKKSLFRYIHAITIDTIDI
ncbi:Uncharacterized protein FWK35_00012538 [Aphis craccivora]|uniref:Uncharacterized protein n=1 Tax=Aphis craccivora TaxID=307492 RepID=A0A6G0YYY5_APHCR|nr:Uncharacterized protein FWK35_00012538 [Aphis craccivora]